MSEFFGFFSFFFFQWPLSSSMKSEQTLMKKINCALKPNWFSEIYWKKLCRGINTVQTVFTLASIQKRKLAAPLCSLRGYKLCDRCGGFSSHCHVGTCLITTTQKAPHDLEHRKQSVVFPSSHTLSLNTCYNHINQLKYTFSIVSSTSKDNMLC